MIVCFLFGKRSLDIVLDKESKPVFEPGQEVAGKIVISCIGSLK